MQKMCSCCGTEKSAEFFYARGNGLTSDCKECCKKKAMEYRAKNKASIKERRKDRQQIDSERRRVWGQANKERLASYMREWRTENKDRELAIAKASRERRIERILQSNKERVDWVKQATPPWAEKWILAEAKKLARLRTKVTGTQWEVDHIVPIKSPKVCGLHAFTNIRVVPKAVNAAKRNLYWPDMA
jgi:hypothetical protein